MNKNNINLYLLVNWKFLLRVMNVFVIGLSLKMRLRRDRILTISRSNVPSNLIILVINNKKMVLQYEPLFSMIILQPIVCRF